MQSTREHLYVVVLAAGEASRFGSAKQLAGWQNGNMVQHAVAVARELVSNRVFVVLGAHAEAVQKTLNQNPVHIVHNPDWQQGLSTSIRAGIEALPEDTEAVLLLLCDQPLLDATSLEQLITGWQQQAESIVASEYDHSIGVPAIFPKNYFAQLAALKGDRGAKQILMAMRDQVLTLSIPEAAMDIDTPEELELLKTQNQNR